MAKINLKVASILEDKNKTNPVQRIALPVRIRHQTHEKSRMSGETNVPSQAFSEHGSIDVDKAILNDNGDGMLIASVMSAHPADVALQVKALTGLRHTLKNDKGSGLRILPFPIKYKLMSLRKGT